MELKISKPITLKCGLTLPNRLIKAAMAEGFADSSHLPASQKCLTVYRQWAKGGWGLVITGNVQIDTAHLGDPSDIGIDVSLPEVKILAAFKAWAATCTRNGTKAVVQLCHPGRQIAFKKEKFAPSAIPMDFGNAIMPRLLNTIVFGTPRAMTADEIQTVISQFVNAACLMAKAGFSGIELHAAHGYLLAQFLSARSNNRMDGYGGSAVARARIVVEIIRAIRNAVPPGFCVGLKLNSVDVGRAVDLSDCLEQVRIIAAVGIDFLEVSGGSFEDPVFSTGLGTGALSREKKTSTLAREAFFIDFAKAIRGSVPNIPLVVTGGFRTRQGMEAALAGGSCDLIGLARPAVMDPLLPRTVLLCQDISTSKANISVKRIPPAALVKMLGVKLLGVGAERNWYTHKMHRIGTVKGSIVVLGASDGLGSVFVNELLSQPDAAREYYGLYSSEAANGSTIAKVMKAEKVGHEYELMDLHLLDLTRTRKLAETINRRVALSLLPPIVALVLSPHLESQTIKRRDVCMNNTVSGKCENKRFLSQFLLMLLLLQSMDKESGRIVFFPTRNDAKGKHKNHRDVFIEHGDSSTKGLLQSCGSTLDACQSCICQQLSTRLSTDPKLSGLSVVGIEPESNEKRIINQITRWIIVAVTALFLFPWQGNSSWNVAKHKPTAQEALRVVLDYVNGIYVSAAAIQESDTDSQAEAERLWQENVVGAAVKDGDTLLANWR